MDQREFLILLEDMLSHLREENTVGELLPVVRWLIANEDFAGLEA